MSHGEYESIKKTKQGFEESFEAGDFYNRQTRDENHLKMILEFLKIKSGMKILDLGTGTGYLAFPIAERYPDTEVTGLDIVEKALCVNRSQAKYKNIKNLNFISYDGISFPFADGTFDMVITRYALHHFPKINDTFCEISRVLKPHGKLFLSDPAPNDNDDERFVDAYMQMKKDGHIKFYTKTEWEEAGTATGLVCTDGFESSIRFPKKRETALEFDDIMDRFNREVIKGYNVEVIGDEIWITEKVNNLLFEKV